MFQSQSKSEGVQPNHRNSMPNSISEEPINRLPSNSGGSANQSQLFYMPNSSSEEPIHPLPSNLRGSSHQSKQFFEPEIELEEEEEEEEAESEGLKPNVSPSSQSNSSSEEPINQLPSEPDQLSRPVIWTAERLNYYRPLFKAAQSGDWKTAKSFIDSDPNVLTAHISINFGTVLHIAAECCQWKFVLMLLELDVSTPHSIAVQNATGLTALHYVARGGSLKTAKALVEKNANLLQMVDNRGCLPLASAVFSKSKELVWYLSLKTRVESPIFPFFIPSLPMILRSLIQAGYHVSGAALQMQRELQWFKEVEMRGLFVCAFWPCSKVISRLSETKTIRLKKRDDQDNGDQVEEGS
ncbi:hypothetical protein QYF36_008279 [Acer negundo]|nr:hypothetical protein QYF36_008279 [Acer negundo]